jgi:SAM-dependent methyltransferase
MQTKTTGSQDIRVDRDTYVRLEFDIRWQSQESEHREVYLARRCNVWRDVFPPGLEEDLLGCRTGDSIVRHYAPGQAVDPYLSSKLIDRGLKEFAPAVDPKWNLRPRFGRFYPKGLLRNLLGVFPGNPFPFRIIGLKEDVFTADLNHPLALYPLEVRVTVLEAAKKFSDVGGRCSAWMEEVLGQGPGMQARWQGFPTDFWDMDGFRRGDESNDVEFHRRPRLVGHIDSQADAFLQEEYARFLQPDMRVLDLMSSLQSHLPMDIDLETVGLGLNQEELDNNPRLDRTVIHDLNEDPHLPFAQAEFDLVACSLSIEYLIHPMQVLQEVRRVLKPGGHCLISFSNRWHAPKAIALWSQLNEFERLGLVQEYLLQAGGFKNLATMSRRNWWRPEDDPRAGELSASDPVYLISAMAG